MLDAASRAIKTAMPRPGPASVGKLSTSDSATAAAGSDADGTADFHVRVTSLTAELDHVREQAQRSAGRAAAAEAQAAEADARTAAVEAHVIAADARAAAAEALASTLRAERDAAASPIAELQRTSEAQAEAAAARIADVRKLAAAEVRQQQLRHKPEQPKLSLLR